MTQKRTILSGRIEMRAFFFFISAAASALALSLFGYALAVDRAVPDSLMPGTYKWFLLKETPGQRLIIESGSNSHHGLDAKRMSNELGVTVINIADNGGYDIEDKVARLERYVAPGDTVLLPLEWSYYYRDEVTDNYFEAMFAGNRDYFNTLSLKDRVKRALTLPPRTLLTLASSAPKPDEMPTIHDLFLSAATSPNGGTTRAQSIGPGPNVSEQSCDDYLFTWGYQNRGLTISNRYRGALKRLAKLRDRGIQVHLAWPAMAGEGCMTSDPALMAFKEAIEAEAGGLGLRYIDTVSNSIFDQSLQDDTPYHLITRGRDLRTARMISALQQAGVRGTGGTADLGTFAYKRLYELERLAADQTERAPLELDETIRTDDEISRSKLNFAAGWWAFEQYGRWMRDNRAVLSLQLPETAAQDANLVLTGRTLAGDPKTLSVFHNGRLLARAPFSSTAPFVLPTGGLPRAQMISLTFELIDADAPKSPAMLGESTDARTMTLHLQTISLQRSSETEPPRDPASAPVADLPAPIILAEQPESAAVRPISALRPTVGGAELDFCTVSPNEDAATAPLGLGEAVSIGDPSSQAKVQFGDKWWDREPGGRWMSCCEAEFSVDLPASAEPGRVLRIYGDVFGGGMTQVTATLNESVSLTVPFRQDVPIEIPLPDSLPAGRARIGLAVADKNLASPLALGLSNDPRILTIFVDTVELTRSTTPAG